MHYVLEFCRNFSLTESKVLFCGCLHLSAHMAEYTSMSICNSCVLYVFMIEQKNLSERSNKRVTPWFIITLKEVLSPLSLHPHLHTLLVMGTCVAHNCTHLCYYIQDTSSWDSEVITPTSMIVTWEGKKIFQDLIVL